MPPKWSQELNPVGACHHHLRITFLLPIFVDGSHRVETCPLAVVLELSQAVPRLNFAAWLPRASLGVHAVVNWMQQRG